MKSKILTISLLLFLHFVSAQQKIEVGEYVVKNKDINLSILNENQFTYSKYKNWNLCMDGIENPPKEEITIARVSVGNGNGSYNIIDGNINLEFSTYKKDLGGKSEIKFLSFNISDLQKK